MEEKALQNLLIDILRSELTVTPINEDIKDKLTSEVIVALYKLSKAHDLAHIVSSALGKLGLLGNDEISAKYQKQEMLSVYRCERINYEFEQICRVLDDANISYIPLKGSVIRPYYPYQSMRTSSDIDIFIKKEDIQIACNTVEAKLMYTGGNMAMSEISYMSPSSVHLEFHFLDGNSSSDDFLVFDDIWSHSKCVGGSRFEIEDKYFLLYHISHMVKHFNGGGCGIRPFMDVRIMEHKMGIDRHCADDLLASAGIDKFASMVFVLADSWFDNKSHTQLTLEVQDYIMNAGIYGTVENYTAISQNKKGGKLLHTVWLIWLPYRLLAAFYPRLKKYPILYPFYQVIRWCRIIFQKGGMRKIASKMGASHSVTDERREHIQKLCRELGI